MVKKTMEKNDSTMPPLRFKITPHHYVDEDGMGSNRGELSIYGQKTIKFKLLYLDGVWQFEIEEFTLGKCFDTRLLENIEELREELIKNAFSDERTVEEHYQCILDYIGQHDSELKLVTGRTGLKKSLYEWAEFVNMKLHTVSDREDNLYVYKGGMYRVDEKCDDIRNLYRDTSLGYYNPGSVSGIVGQVKTINRTPDEDFNPDRNIVNFPNGILNLKTGELYPHTPDIISTIQLPHPYIPNGKSEKIDRILGEILQPGDIVPLKEFCGYGMTLKINFKRAMIFVGDRGAGKNTIQDVINACVGQENIEAFKLQELSNRFNLYSLKGKLLNSADELPTKKLGDNSTFKMLTSGSEWIQMEGKHKKSERFRHFIKLLFSANQVPESAVDDDEAYYIRWTIIEFLQHFDTQDERTNTEILESLTADDYAQFGSECIELFMDVLKRDQFTGDIEEDEKMLQYRLKSNPIKEFLKILEPDAGYITKAEMHEIYELWCGRVGIPDASRYEYAPFWKAFKKESEWKDGMKGARGSQVSVIREVKVAEEWSDRLLITVSPY